MPPLLERHQRRNRQDVHDDRRHIAGHGQPGAGEGDRCGVGARAPTTAIAPHYKSLEDVSTAQIFGFSVAYLPTFIIHGAVAAGRLDVCLTEYSREPSALHVVYPSTRNLPAKVRVFIDFLVEKFGEEPYWDRGIF